MIESDYGTVNYIQSENLKCVMDLDVEHWCLRKKSIHLNDSLFGQDQCPVCFDQILNDSTVLKLGCGHILHFESANTWFSTCINDSKCAKCPLCNYTVLCPVIEIAVPVRQYNPSIVARIVRNSRGS